MFAFFCFFFLEMDVKSAILRCGTEDNDIFSFATHAFIARDQQCRFVDKHNAKRCSCVTLPPLIARRPWVSTSFKTCDAFGKLDQFIIAHARSKLPVILICWESLIITQVSRGIFSEWTLTWTKAQTLERGRGVKNMIPHQKHSCESMALSESLQKNDQ